MVAEHLLYDYYVQLMGWPRRRAIFLLAGLLCCFHITRARAQILVDQILPCDADTGQALSTEIGTYKTANIAVPVFSYLPDGYHNYVLTSTDSGKSWKRGEVPYGPWPGFTDRYFHSVYYINENNIIIAGDTGLFFRSTDGGLHWSDQSFQTKVGTLSSAFYDSSVGIACGGGGFNPQITNDAGKTWTPIAWNPHYLFTSPRIFSRDSFSFYRSGSGPIYYVSQHGQKVDSTPTLFNSVPDSSGYRVVSQIYWTSKDGEGIAYGVHYRSDFSIQQTLFMSTTDGGYHWTTLLDRNTRLRQGPTAVSVLDDGAAIVTGIGNGVLWTRNWRTGPWYEDTIGDQYSGSADVSNVVMLDDIHALAWFDAPVVRLTLPEKSRVAYHCNPLVTTTIYPNPATLSLTVSSNISGEMHLLDILGRDIIQNSVQAGEALSIDISKLPRGIYIVSLQSEGRTVSAGRVVVMGE